MPKTSLPPSYSIKAVKWLWVTLWQQMMSRIAPRDKLGAYIRPESEFRHFLSNEPESRYKPACGRYRLYVGLGCPWAHRTLVVRAVKGLEEVIAVSIVVPAGDRGIWTLQQPEENCTTLPDLYRLAQPNYQGRCTVPVLWDSETKTIVNNESGDIIQILNADFNSWATNSELNLYPESLQTNIDHLSEKIYHSVNNGVYRCGFAQTQAAYNQAVTELFNTLTELEDLLTQQPYLCGETITLVDVRLFTTLFRFDLVYHGLFKCNYRRIVDYPNLSAYLTRIYSLPGVAATCNAEQIKQDYYGNLFPLNPGGIIPIGPERLI
ncbi:MAG: glutathione S-transferase family protein [Gloeocapsa sp. DLM2.Bin57]|nr:MAG: glutathione S-transferase family protein [Gloeocapsa sp. DLM2.Bin57]